MSADYKIRGVQGKHEKNASEVYRDSRRLGEKIYDVFCEPKPLGLTFIFLAILIVAIPAFALAFFIVSLLFWVIFSGKSLKSHLPMRLPIEHPGLDYNDPLPGRSFFRTTYRKARGIFFLGNEKMTNEELHMSADDMLTHMLLFGTTGAGKTEALLSLSWNSLAMGSGLIFIDPKGTNKLPLQIYTLARIVGRDDDFMLINFSTGNKDIDAFSNKRSSNTANPFAYGTADSLAEILVSLIPTSEGENAVFSERAVSLIYTVMRPLTDLRNLKEINLSIRTIRDHMTLEQCMKLAEHPRISQTSRASMNAYLSSVSGFKPGAPYDKQGEDAHKQFGFAQAYFTRAMSSLVDTYGHVYGAMMGEVDYPDIVFQRRILCVLLPAMEKPPAEIKTLGKIILSAIRGAMSLGLGNEFEGTAEDMLDSLPTASNVPNLVIADEYGYVATDGFAVTAAQARGLGFSCIFAGQDFAGFKRGSETEAEQILANTKVKIIMALEDALSTLDVVKAIGGEAIVTNTAGYTIDGDGLGSGYRDNLNVSLEKRGRVDVLDLRDQIEGEFHVFHKANMVRGQMFHADPPIRKGKGMRINRFLEVERPSSAYLKAKYGPVRDLSKILKNITATRKPCKKVPLRSNDVLILKASSWLDKLGRSALPTNDRCLIAWLLASEHALPADNQDRRGLDTDGVASADNVSKPAGKVNIMNKLNRIQGENAPNPSMEKDKPVKTASDTKNTSPEVAKKATDSKGKVGNVASTKPASNTSDKDKPYKQNTLESFLDLGIDKSRAVASTSPEEAKPKTNSDDATVTATTSDITKDIVVPGMIPGAPSFMNEIINNAGAAHDEDLDEDLEDDDEDDADAEIKELLMSHIRDVVVSDKDEVIKKCVTTIDENADIKESSDEFASKVASSLVEYPSTPVPTNTPQTQMDIKSKINRLTKIKG